ncbi:acyl-CoA thioesterase [Alteromonas oceanisediminis]|uniref:acyl-CoA thioesterase n=1 Tax=Alteromonas oceanisediminis TaxID=2836180 RepID=UPI001BD98A16|nr:acyl-CoA thioesterase [Alteromonas oceanisediminis]MBT0587212.1 acyl-CoA thioesterase [Alteromonas oceanisediminis]
MQVDTLLRVRFGECDPQNVVFNARYADYVDIASTEYLRFLCNGYDSLQNAGLMTQVVNLTINWKNAATFDQVLLLEMTCERIGTTSFTLNCNITHYESANPSVREIATASVTYVVMSEKTASAVPIPEAIKEALGASHRVGPINYAGHVGLTR